MFRAEHRETRRVENFFAGEHAANELLRIIPAPMLPRFNPLVDDDPDDDIPNNPNPVGPHDPGRPGDEREQHRRARTALNRELFRAVRLFVYWVPGDPGRSLSGLIQDIDERPNDRRNASFVKSLNTMVGAYGTTLRQMIIDLEARGNVLRHFEFPLIRAVIDELPIPNNIDP